jgi:hypothetical protein
MATAGLLVFGLHVPVPARVKAAIPSTPGLVSQLERVAIHARYKQGPFYLESPPPYSLASDDRTSLHLLFVRAS